MRHGNGQRVLDGGTALGLPPLFFSGIARGLGCCPQRLLVALLWRARRSLMPPWGLCLPLPSPHSLHDGPGADVVQVPGGCRNAGVPKLLADNANVNTLCPHFSSPGMAQSVRMNSLFDVDTFAQPGE